MDKENKTETTDPFKDWTEKDHLLELHRIYEAWDRTDWSYSDWRIEALTDAELTPHIDALTHKYGYTNSFRDRAREAYLKEQKDKDRDDPECELE